MAPQKPPLVTPSATPPLNRSNQYSSVSGYLSGPPPKRRRLSSTPRLSIPSSDPIFDAQAERKKSERRMLDVWSSLGDRYYRHIEEDDIVDIRTGQLIKDRGVVRAMNKHGFGEAEEEQGEIEDDEDEVDEESADELDTLTPRRPKPTIEDKNAEPPEDVAPFMRTYGGLPPLDPNDPQDADSLREFMEAERKHRQLYGDPDESDGHVSEVYEEDAAGLAAEIEQYITDDTDSVPDVNERVADVEDEEDSSSDDELRITYTSCIVPSSSPPSSPCPAPRHSMKPHSRQLQTPPSSFTSDDIQQFIPDMQPKSSKKPSPKQTLYKKTKPQIIPHLDLRSLSYDDSSSRASSSKSIQIKQKSPLKNKRMEVVIIAKTPSIPESFPTLAKPTRKGKERARPFVIESDSSSTEPLTPEKHTVSADPPSPSPVAATPREVTSPRARKSRRPSTDKESINRKRKRSESNLSITRESSATYHNSEPSNTFVPHSRHAYHSHVRSSSKLRQEETIDDIRKRQNQNPLGESCSSATPESPTTYTVSELDSGHPDTTRYDYHSHANAPQARPRSMSRPRPEEMSGGRVYSNRIPSLDRFQPPPIASHYPYPYPSPVRPYIPEEDRRYIVEELLHYLQPIIGVAPSQRYTTPYFSSPASSGHYPVPHPSSVYSTPRHSSYAYDPSFSRGTLPPSSPDVGSSPVYERHSSLVHRSRSKGRRVSFNIATSGSDDGDSDSPLKGKQKQSRKEKGQDKLELEGPRREEINTRRGRQPRIDMRSSTPAPVSKYVERQEEKEPVKGRRSKSVGSRSGKKDIENVPN